MKVRLFVTSSAALLSVWLAACFLRVVDLDSYPAQPGNAGVSAPKAETGPVVHSADDGVEGIVSAH